MQYITLFLFIPIMVHAHSGKLDSNGGHTNHATGKYHLHTGKAKSLNPLDTTIRIQILKYGGPHGWGQSFSSIDRCKSEIKHREQQNKGLDYTYVCAIK